MATETTQATMMAYLDAIVQRGAFAAYFADDVTFTLMGPGQQVRGKDEVEQYIRFLHEQAFEAHPTVKAVIVGDGQAALEAEFVGTHTGEFLGVPATGRQVRVPYVVIYELDADTITALRGYLPMDVLMQQIGAMPGAPTAES